MAGFAVKDDNGNKVEPSWQDEEDNEPSAPPDYEPPPVEPVMVLPPAYVPDPKTQAGQEIKPFQSNITEAEVREALHRFASKKIFYREKAIAKLTFSDIQTNNAFCYTLDTFCEKRLTLWRTVAFKNGDSLDGPENGPQPDIWDIELFPSEGFTFEETSVEVPHTATSKKCYKCKGRGKKTCRSCWGQGGSSCSSCHGSGRQGSDRRNCGGCGGRGSVSCSSCGGRGYHWCPVCEGLKVLKTFLELTVTWTVRSDDGVVDGSSLPTKKVKKVKGEFVVDDSGQRVYELSNFPDESVARASGDLIEKHVTANSMEKILEQRQTVKVVPVAVVTYAYPNKKPGIFYVYGLERKIYFPKYPSKCVIL